MYRAFIYFCSIHKYKKNIAIISVIYRLIAASANPSSETPARPVWQMSDSSSWV